MVKKIVWQQVPTIFGESSFLLLLLYRDVFFSLRLQLSHPETEEHFLPASIPERKFKQETIEILDNRGDEIEIFVLV